MKILYKFGQSRNLLSRIKGLGYVRLAIILLRFGISALRCMLKSRRIGVMMSGARIIHLKGFENSGLFILENYSTLDCFGSGKLKVGENFKLGKFSTIALPGSYLSKGCSVTIGDNVGIGDFSYIGGEGPVEIGSDTISGQYLSIHPQNHTVDGSELFRNGKPTSDGIIVGNNVWLGAKVTLLDGCRIGSNSIVAAGSVVTGKFPENSLIAGVPAKLVRQNVI